jgi:hypothetical protein
MFESFSMPLDSNEIFAGLVSIVAIAVVFAVSRNPKDVVSNLAEWLKVFGVDRPHWLNEEKANLYARILAILLFLGVILAWVVPNYPKKPEPDHDPDTLYQYGEAVGTVGGAEPNENDRRILFAEVKIFGKADPTKSFEYREWKVLCSSLPRRKPEYPAREFGAGGVQVDCKIVGKRQ